MAARGWSAEDFREWVRQAERGLRETYGGDPPQAGLIFLMRVRAIAALPDEEIERILGELDGADWDQIVTAVGLFAEMFSEPGMRLVEGLPDAAEAAVRAAVGGDAPAGCRHVLATAAARLPAPCFICVAHPGEARCAPCHEAHITSVHSREHELTCDWCGAVCMQTIFPMPIPLGSLAIVRNLASRRTVRVGPVYLNGLGACYGCRRKLVRQSRTAAEAFEAVRPPAG